MVSNQRLYDTIIAQVNTRNFEQLILQYQHQHHQVNEKCKIMLS